jgi:hypothetical protein
MPDDPRDDLYTGIAALGALGDVLLHAARPGRGDLHLVDPEGLYCLLECIGARLRAAQEGFRDWRPA